MNPKIVNRLAVVSCLIDSHLHRVSQSVPDWLRIELCKAVQDFMSGTENPDNATTEDTLSRMMPLQSVHSVDTWLIADPAFDGNQVCHVCSHTYTEHAGPDDGPSLVCTVCGHAGFVES